MKTYTLRDKHGTMIAKIGGVIADNILRDSSGFWRKYDNTQCYEFTDSFVFGLGNNDNRNTFKLYLWSGSKMIENE